MSRPWSGAPAAGISGSRHRPTLTRQGVEAESPPSGEPAPFLAWGESPGEGLHGHWVQARYVNLFIADAGGRVFAEASDEKVTFAATLPG